MKERRREDAIILVRKEHQSRAHGKELEIPSKNAPNNKNQRTYTNGPECCWRNISQGVAVGGAHVVLSMLATNVDCRTYLFDSQLERVAGIIPTLAQG